MLRGAAHAHSTFSFDGKLNHSQLRNLFLKKGFRFVLMSEHVEHQTFERLTAAIAACHRESTSDFLFVPGIEIEDLHVLLYGVPTVPACMDSIALFRHARATGCLVVLSHPVKISSQLNPEVVEALDAVEIWNSRYDGKLFPRWDNLKYLKNGNSPVPIIGHDVHSTADISTLAIEVEAKRLEAADVLAGIRSGNARMVRGSKPIRLDRSDTYKTTTHLYTAARDLSYRANRFLRGAKVPIPSGIRRFLKKFI